MTTLKLVLLVNVDGDEAARLRELTGGTDNTFLGNMLAWTATAVREGRLDSKLRDVNGNTCADYSVTVVKQ